MRRLSFHEKRNDPARPTVREGRTRKDEILDEATRLFAERGYEGASLADLAARVGLRKASLFHHFASKDILYAEVIELLLRPLAAAMESAVLTPGSFAERLDAMTDAVTLSLARHPYAARLIVREVIAWGPVIRARLATTLHVLDAAYRFAVAGQEAGAFVVIDPKQLIMSLLGAYFFPFAASDLVEGYVGQNPFDPRFIEERRASIRDQVRRLVLAPTSPT